MGYSLADAAYDAYMADFNAELDDLLEGFGFFFASVARLLHTAGMVISTHLQIPDDRLDLFRSSILEPLSLSAVAGIIQRIMQAQSLEGSKRLASDLRKVNDYRNRLAHDSLVFDLSPEDGSWPAIRRRPAFTEREIGTIKAGELRLHIDLCHRLESRIRGILLGLTTV